MSGASAGEKTEGPAVLDPYGATNTLDAESIAVVVERLEARGRYPAFAAMLDQYLDAMSIDGATAVLDIGCGTGVATRRIAARPDFRGLVTGIDLSRDLADAATRLAAEDGLSDKVSFHAGDTHALGLDDESVDAVVAHTLFSHVSDPLLVLAEAARVVRPGGLIGVFDGDYASRSFEFADPARSRKMQQIIDTVVTQPRVMRRLPRLAAQLGLDLIANFPNVICEAGKADFYLSTIRSFATLGPRSGAITSSDATAWVAELTAASDDGVFFGSTTYYAYVMRRPDTLES